MRLRGVSEDGEELNASLEDLVKNLTGVDLTDANGEFRSTYDILVDISKVYDTLDSKEQALLLEEIAGKNRANVLAAILQNAEQLENAYDTLKDSAGSAQEEQNAYMDSLSGKINALKESLTGLSIQVIDSDAFKGLVDGATTGVQAVSKLIDTFGAFPTTVTAVVGAMTVLNSKFRENSDIQLKLLFPSYSKISDTLKQTEEKILAYRNAQLKTVEVNKTFASGIQGSSVSLQGLSKELVTSQAKAVLATAGLVSMKVATLALQAALSMGLSLAISGVISLITKWISSIDTAEEKAEKLAEASKNLADAMTEYEDNSDLLASYEKIKKQIDDISTTEEERNVLNKELDSIKSQLYEADNQAYSILNNQNLSLERQLELLEAINKEKVKEKAEELEDSMGKQYDADAMGKDVEIYANTIKELQDAINNYDSQAIAKILGTGKDFDDAKDAIEEYKEKIRSLQDEIDIWNSNVKMLKENGLGEDLSYVELDGTLETLLSTILNVSDSLEEMSGNVSDASNNSDNLESATNSLTETYKALGYSVEEAKERIAELNGLSLDNQNAEVVKDATKAYGEAISEAKELDSLIKELNETQSMTPELIMELSSKYPELGSRITDVAAVQEFLNNKVQEQVQAQVEAYRIMVENDQQYYNSKVQNNEELNKNFQSLCSAFVDDQGNAYSIDLKNYTSLAQLKAKLTDDLGEGVANFITNFVTAQAQGYNVDLSNTASWASSKAKILNDLNNQIKKLTNNMNNALAKIQSDSYTGMKAGDLEAEKLYKMASDQLKETQAKYDEIQTEFSTYNKGFSTYTPSFSTGSFSGGSSGNKGSSGSSSKEKEVADLEDLRDRYVDLNNAITKVENSLTALNTEMENADDEERIKLLQKEITLLGDKRKALENLKAEQQKELSELKTQLSNNGFKFNSEGDITNINAQLETLRQKANSLSGEAKENAIASVEAIADIVERYNELLLDVIPETTNEIADMKNEIIDAQKEIADILADQRDEYIDNLEKETDALKKELEKRKNLLQQSWDEEDYEDDLNEYQLKINELESELTNALRTGDDEYIKSVREQIAEAQKELNDFIRDHERELAEERIDSEIDALDEDLEAKIEEINNKLSDEQILALVQQGVTDLSSTLDSITNSTKSITTAFASVGTIINDNWISSLDTFISKLSTINASIPAISLTTTGNLVSGASGGISVTGGNIIIEGNVTEDILPQVEDMIEDSNKKLVQELNSILGRR